LQLNVEAPTPLVVPPSLRLVTAILSAAASAGYPEEVAGGAHRFGQVERKTLSRRKCRCRRSCCSSRVTSACEHYDLAGFAEKREGAFIPDEWDEAAYLKANPDVAAVVARGTFINGYHHYLAAGRHEGRKMARRPSADYPAEVSGACSKAHVLVFRPCLA
jgi:hypothetical protein